MKSKTVFGAVLAFLICSSFAVAAEKDIKAEGFRTAERVPAPGQVNYNIEISKASIDFSGGEYRVIVNGKTGLPDGGRIYVFLKKGEFPLNCKIARAAGGRFSAELGPFQVKLPVGIYSVEASLSAGGISGTKDAFRLTAGRPEDAAKEEESNMAALSASFASVSGLFDELERKRADSREDFDPAEWNKWSEGWASRLKKEQQAVDNNIKPLLAGDYSGPGQSLSQVIRDLDQLCRVYSSELAGGSIRDAYPYAFRDPAQLRAVINESLKNSKKVVLTNRALNGI
ncbi:MAG: hypothetical protein WC491_04365 [Candidatus Omnitrophota bacterium]